jgi:hypothetical protein
MRFNRGHAIIFLGCRSRTQISSRTRASKATRSSTDMGPSGLGVHGCRFTCRVTKAVLEDFEPAGAAHRHTHGIGCRPSPEH